MLTGVIGGPRLVHAKPKTPIVTKGAIYNNQYNLDSG
jgi:hypothetical protein